MKFIEFLVDYRIVIGLAIFLICLLISLFTMFPLIQKFKGMEDIPVGEAEAEARFNEINKYNKSKTTVSSSPESVESDVFFFDFL